MIGTTLEFIRKYLDGQLRLTLGGSFEDGETDIVVFPEGSPMPADSIQFTAGTVTMLLANLEEERIPYEANPYRRLNDNGSVENVKPDIRLNLYILFVANFSSYATSWNNLTSLLKHLQSIHALDSETAPALPQGLECLIFELVSQSFSELNDVWNALRTAHHPSLLYRVRMLTIQDSSGSPAIPITAVEQTVRTWSGS